MTSTLDAWTCYSCRSDTRSSRRVAFRHVASRHVTLLHVKKPLPFPMWSHDIISSNLELNNLFETPTTVVKISCDLPYIQAVHAGCLNFALSIHLYAIACCVFGTNHVQYICSRTFWRLQFCERHLQSHYSVNCYCLMFSWWIYEMDILSNHPNVSIFETKKEKPLKVFLS